MRWEYTEMNKKTTVRREAGRQPIRQLIQITIILVLMLSSLASYAQQRGVVKVNDDGSISGSIQGTQVDLGTYHALLIGIEDYQNPEFASRLQTPLSDIARLEEILIESYGFEKERIRVLTEQDATRNGILGALRQYRDAPLKESDNLLIYFAGHGWQNSRTEDGFWIPQDATSQEETWVSIADIKRIIKRITARHTLLISDSCFSGALTRQVLSVPNNDRFLVDVAGKDSYQVITSGGLEPVADGGKAGLSLFAYMLTSYMTDKKDSYFTADQLYNDLAPMVANASDSEQTPEHGKIPSAPDQRGQFIFARTDLPSEKTTRQAFDPVDEAPTKPVEPNTQLLQVFESVSTNYNNGYIDLNNVSVEVYSESGIVCVEDEDFWYVAHGLAIIVSYYYLAQLEFMGRAGVDFSYPHYEAESPGVGNLLGGMAFEDIVQQFSSRLQELWYSQYVYRKSLAEAIKKYKSYYELFRDNISDEKLLLLTSKADYLEDQDFYQLGFPKGTDRCYNNPVGFYGIQIPELNRKVFYQFGTIGSLDGYFYSFWLRRHKEGTDETMLRLLDYALFLLE
jgi:hypothetical protein